MNDQIARLRHDAELEETENADTVTGEVALDDAILAEFYATHSGVWFDPALEVLGERGQRNEAPDAGAQVDAATRRARQRSVLEALSAPSSVVRSALTAILRISVDAAELLLERPASALLSYEAPRVAALAQACGKARGEVFLAVADSVRAADPYVYAYRPGPTVGAPARLAPDSSTSGADLLAWGRELFDLAPPPDQTSR
jgi:hypothetical protein